MAYHDENHRQLTPQAISTISDVRNTPLVCAWYPTARAVVLWNLTEQRQEWNLRYGDTHRAASVNGLDVALIEGVGSRP